MAKGVKVTEGKFKAAKILLNAGAKYREIAETLGVSECVIGIIKKSETFEEYKRNMYITSGAYRKKMNAQAEKQKNQPTEKPEIDLTANVSDAPDTVQQPQVIEHRQNITIQATHYMTEELREMKELLKGISNKLAYIVEELTGG